MDEPLSPDALGRIAAKEYDLAIADSQERVRIQWGIADAMLKALFLANGGAMVALFTLVGALSKGQAPSLLGSGHLWAGFILFVSGLTLALLAHFFAFMSQHHFLHQAMGSAWRHRDAAERKVGTAPTDEEKRHFARGNAAYFLGLLVAFLAVICFAVGCAEALRAFLPQ